jgi:AAA family ATP:ADP antiporter
MQISDVQNRPFGKIRNFLWPIHHFELKKLVPMFALFFLISFVYNLLRCLKISLIVKAPGSGVEVLPFLKIWAVLPGALVLTYIFTKLISRFTREQVFYTMVSGFLVYFALFLFVLYPNHHYLQLDTLADFLQSHAFSGEGSKGFISLVRHLNLTIFYVLSEMWSAVVLSMLFWGFANEVTKVDEAKRFYAIFALGANFSGMFSGEFAQIIEKIPYISFLPFDEKHQWIFFQLCTVLFFGVIILGLFFWLNKYVFHIERVQASQIPKKAKKLSLRECFSYLSKSRYLTYLVIIVIGYNIVYNLADVMWTYKVDLVYKTDKELNSYLNLITAVTSFIAVTCAFLVSGNVIRRFGWTVAALITPLVWFLTSIGFFSGLVFEKSAFFGILSTFVSNPANLVLMMGSLQICLGRGCKYTVFDEAKEIAFIPLPKENQRKGKAVVDGLASRFGKSGGAIIYTMLFGLFSGDVAAVIPYVSVIIFVALGAWVYAVLKLGKIVDKVIDGDDIHLTIKEEELINEEHKRKRDLDGGALPQAN